VVVAGANASVVQRYGPEALKKFHFGQALSPPEYAA
jgi:hypothetical protein